MAEVEWEKVHSGDKSWRTKLIGDISTAYVMPRYAELFEQYLKGDGAPKSFLELGSGNGEMASLIAEKKFPFIGQYFVSEWFHAGVQWLKSQGLNALQLSAENIPFKDESFDVVVCFDVMHHVDRPGQMGLEMMRAGRGKLFLTESNGLSAGRKLMELTPGHRAAGERSYTPSRYRSFFEHAGYRVTHFEIHPFIFPLKLPARFTRWNIAFNRWIERAYFIRWQCSNVYIYVEYERV